MLFDLNGETGFDLRMVFFICICFLGGCVYRQFADVEGSDGLWGGVVRAKIRRFLMARHPMSDNTSQNRWSCVVHDGNNRLQVSPSTYTCESIHYGKLIVWCENVGSVRKVVE